MDKGIKSSEFYIALAVLAPWISQQFGINLQPYLANPDDIAGMITAAHQQGGNAPVWVALAYVIGRALLKWRAK